MSIKFRLIIRLTLLLVFLGLAGAVLATTVQAAKLYFDPGDAAVLSNRCTENSLAIMLDTQGLSVNAADVEIGYNQNEIDVIDQNALLNDIQIKPGLAFESYRGNKTSGGKILLTGSSFLQNLNGIAPFGYIVFKPRDGVLTTKFTIKFDGVGATLDSNIAQAVTNLDVLTQVQNATVNFANTPCPTSIANDTTPPLATMITPPNQSTDNPISTNIVLQLQDASTGVDLESLEVTVNSIKYTINSPELSYTGTPNDYQVTIDPAVDLPAGQLIPVQVSVRDLANNLLIEHFEFNNPSLGVTLDTDQPIVALISPTDGSHNVDLNTAIELRIRDTGTGVDLSSLVVLVDNQEYRLNTEGVSYTGTTKDYIIKIHPKSPLSASKKIVIDVTVSDLTGNTTVSLFSFNQPPQDVFQSITQTIFEPSDHPLAGTPLQGTVIETFIAQNGVAAVGNVAITAILVLNLLSFVNFLLTPNVLTEVIGLLFGKRPSKTWGIVIDAQTRKPVPFAVVRLYVASTLSVVDQKVTDLEGRYGFVVPAGKYRMEVNHTDYRKASVDIDISTDPTRVNFDIRIIPNSNDLTVEEIGWPRKLWKSWRNLIKRVGPYLFGVGFLSAVVSVILAATLLNVLLLCLYIVLLILSLPAIFPRQPKSSMVIDSSNNLRVPSAVVKIYDLTTWELVDSQLTSLAGLFDFWGVPGEYGVLIAARGYKFPSDKNADLPRINRKYDSVLKVYFKKGNNHLKLYIDPIASPPSIAEILGQKNSGNLSSPFN